MSPAVIKIFPNTLLWTSVNMLTYRVGQIK